MTIECGVNCAGFLVSEHTVKAMLPTIRISFLALRPSVYRISLTKKTVSYVVKNSLKCKKGEKPSKKRGMEKKADLIRGSNSNDIAHGSLLR